MLHLRNLLLLLCLGHLNHLAFADDGVCSRTYKWSDTGYDTLEKACETAFAKPNWISPKTCRVELNKLWKRAGGELTCCEGYEKDSDTQTCKPECSDGCVHGVCSAPNQCDCAVNFGGLDCTKTCPNGTFGVDCEHDCKLLLDEKTNGNLTACACHDKDEVTSKCWATCECKRSTLCKAGWVGPTCSKPCPEFTFGRHCSANCTCVQENTSRCDRTNGVCYCKSHYYGTNCEHLCDGIYKCSDYYPRRNCTCEPTLEQKVARLAEQREASEHRFRVYLSVGSLALLVVLAVLFALVYKLKRRTGKLMNLEKGSARYTARKSGEQPGEQEIENPIYDVSLNFESGAKQEGEHQERERRSNWLEGKLGSTLHSAKSLFTYRTQSTGDETKLTEEKPETIYETITKRQQDDETVKKTGGE